MSFREKSAWITFLTVLVVFGGYYGAIHLHLVPPSGPQQFHLLMGCIALVIVLQIVLHILVAILNPQDARSPKDERERQIEARAHVIGYYVLATGVFIMFPLGHMDFGVSKLLHWAFFSMVASSIALSLTQIVLYRRGG